MSTYTEKLQKFLEEDCGADWGNCPNCPGDHYKNGACHHPDHPAMQEDKNDERSSESQNKVHPHGTS